MNHIQFYTATIFRYKHLLKDRVNKKIILDSSGYQVTKEKIRLYAYVIIPNHIHLIWKTNEEFKQSDIQDIDIKITDMRSLR